MRHMHMLFAVVLLPFTLLACSEQQTQQAENLQQYADNLMEQAYLDLIPGAIIAVSKGDEIIYRGARGQANAELEVPLSPDHVMRIGSVTKQFAAAAILMLADDGKLNLDDPVSKFLPDYPNGENITVLQLLNHTSGIKSYTSIEGVMDGPIRLDASTEEMIASFENIPVDFQPGENWSYNNSGYVLLGAIIETITGKAWYAYMQDAIFSEYDLKKTEFGGNDLLIRGLTNGYTLIDGNLAPAPILSMTQPHAAGALVSTPEDLLRWNMILHGGKLLEENSYKQMITPQGKAIDAEYGFGINNRQFRGETMLSHGGGIHGFNSFLMYLPESEIGVAIIQNSDSPLSDFRPSEIAFRIAAYALGKPFPEPVIKDLSKSELKEYEGVYQINDTENRIVRIMGDQLTSQRTGGVPIPLMPVGNDQFLFDNGMDVLKFTRGNDGEVSGMELITIKDSAGTFSQRTTASPPETPDISDLSQKQKERIAGTYQGGPGLTLHVRLEGGKVMVQLEGQDALEATPQNADHYFIPQTGASLEFAAGNKAPSVTLSQGGRSVILNR